MQRRHLLRGERNREFVPWPHARNRRTSWFARPHLPTSQFYSWIPVCASVRPLAWNGPVKLEAAQGAKFGYLTVLSENAESRKSRNVRLGERAVPMLRKWKPTETGHVFHREDGRSRKVRLTIRRPVSASS